MSVAPIPQPEPLHNMQEQCPRCESPRKSVRWCKYPAVGQPHDVSVCGNDRLKCDHDWHTIPAPKAKLYDITRERDIKRYRWLRSHLEHINFEGLTSDTCDVGLDYAIDLMIEGKER